MRYFIPSTKNFFGRFQCREVMWDSGCNSHLLALPDEDSIQSLSQLYPSDQYSWNVVISSGVSSAHLVLHISPLCVGGISYSLNNDLIEGQTGTLDYLRFYLCGDDVKYLIQAADAGLVPLNGLRLHKLKVFCTTCPSVLEAKRRRHSLIGQDIARSFSIIDHHGLCLFVDAELFGPKAWVLLLSCRDYLENDIELTNKPENFDTLEDEDHIAEDDLMEFYGDYED